MVTFLLLRSDFLFYRFSPENYMHIKTLDSNYSITLKDNSNLCTLLICLNPF